MNGGHQETSLGAQPPPNVPQDLVHWAATWPLNVPPLGDDKFKTNPWNKTWKTWKMIGDDDGPKKNGEWWWNMMDLQESDDGPPVWKMGALFCLGGWGWGWWWGWWWGWGWWWWCFLWNIPRHIVFSSTWHVLFSTLLANFCLTLLIRKTWDRSKFPSGSYWKHVRSSAMFLLTRLWENVGLLLSRAMAQTAFGFFIDMILYVCLVRK